MVLAPGGRRGACQMLFRLWPPRLRSHCRLAAIGAFERGVFPVGPGATRRTGTRVLPEILAENPAIQRPQPLTESVGTAALLCRPERGLRQGPRAAAAADRRPAVVRSGLLRMAAFVVPRRHGVTNSGGGHGAAGRDRTDSPARQPVERSAPVRQVVELPLSPLTAEETAALAAQVANRPLDAADSGALYRTTQGAIRCSWWRACAPRDSSGAIATPPRGSTPSSPRAWRNSPPKPMSWPDSASAIGQSFSLDLLAKATDWDDDSLSAALDELWQRRIIEGQGEAHGVAAYDFTHDRLREVTYAELSPVRRRFLHRRIALALEELHGAALESVSGQLARTTKPPAWPSRRSATMWVRRRWRATGTPMPRQRGLLRRAWRSAAASRRVSGATIRNWSCWQRSVPCWSPRRATATPEVGELYERALLLSRRLEERSTFLPY